MWAALPLPRIEALDRHYLLTFREQFPMLCASGGPALPTQAALDLGDHLQGTTLTESLPSIGTPSTV
jgi:hypothetical protein